MSEHGTFVVAIVAIVVLIVALASMRTLSELCTEQVVPEGSPCGPNAHIERDGDVWLCRCPVEEP